MRRQMRSQRELKKTIKRIKAFVTICRRNESKLKKHFAFTIHSEDKIETSRCASSHIKFSLTGFPLRTHFANPFIRATDDQLAKVRFEGAWKEAEEPSIQLTILPLIEETPDPLSHPILLRHPIHPTLSNKGQKNTNTFPKRSLTTKRHHETSG